MAQTLPPGIEIFKAGRHTDDGGVVHNFSQADVAGMVAAYDPALREAPLTVGHPAHNLPAYGWVQGLQLNAANNLAMATRAVEPQFAEMVQTQRFPKRSASFYPPGHPNNPKPGKWYLRHVAFLGAQPPAIAGLKDIAFAEADPAGIVNFSFDDASGTVNFSQAPHLNQEISMTQELTAKLVAAEKLAADNQAALTAAQATAKQATDQLAQFAEGARTQRTAGFVSFAEAQIKTGALLPKEKDAAVAVLDTLADAKAVSFAEAGAVRTVSAVDWLKDLITRAKPVVSFGEHAAGTLPGTGQGAAGLSDAEIDGQAKAYARQHKVAYAEALSAVVGFTS
jgi:hypothetical protein